MNQDIPLQVHHVNGNNTDNRLENLQILCPNCHALTETYCGKNKKESICKKIYKQYGFCECCGKSLTHGQSKFCSVECSNSDKKINNITKDELINSFIEYKSFVGVAKHYGVSDKAIVKWLEKYELPTHINELREYISTYENKM